MEHKTLFILHKHAQEKKHAQKTKVLTERRKHAKKDKNTGSKLKHAQKDESTHKR